MKPVIAVNTRLLIQGKLDGIGWFTYHTLKRLTAMHPEYRFRFLFDRPYDPRFIFNSNVEPVVSGPPARHPFLYYWWFEKRVPEMLRQSRAGLFLSPDGFLSLSTDVPSIPVIHDINFHHAPENLPWLLGRYYNHYFPKFARKASRIATVSDYSARDISQTYGIAPDRIEVVYNGPSSNFHPLNDHEQQAVREKLTGGAPYFLFVGTLHPRKNIINQLKAFDRFCAGDTAGHKLVIVGQKFYWTSETEKVYRHMQYRDRVIFTGRLEDRALNDAYAAATALLFVSFFEGFGIPVIEAYATHTPVITSDTSSLPEVAGDAALIVPPGDPEAIAGAMNRIVKDVNKRIQLIEAARIRKDTFTWQRTADLLWAAIAKELDAAEIFSKKHY